MNCSCDPFQKEKKNVRTKVALLLSEQDNLVGNNLEHQEDHATKLYMFINFMESMDEWISQVMTSWAHYHLKRLLLLTIILKGVLSPKTFCPQEPSAGAAAGGEQRQPLAGSHLDGHHARTGVVQRPLHPSPPLHLAGGHCAGGSGHCGRGCEGLLFSSSAIQLAPGQLQQ